jgi:hypothetical protein
MAEKCFFPAGKPEAVDASGKAERKRESLLAALSRCGDLLAKNGKTHGYVFDVVKLHHRLMKRYIVADFQAKVRGLDDFKTGRSAT